jgi:hypothetical protein
MSPRLRRSAILCCAAVVLAACSSKNGTGPQGPPGSQAFSPSHDTSLAGTIQFKSVTIPAGVTVTATGPLTLEVSGATQIAGTLAAPCFPLKLLDSGTVTVSGTVNNACNGATPAASPDLTIFGHGGLLFQGATFKSAGVQLYTNDTTLTDASFAAVHNLAPASASISDFTSGTASCDVGTTTFIADAPTNGADGSPTGSPGQNGDPWALQCTGGLNLSGVSVVGQDGGKGGKGTTTNATTAQGGKGGTGGTLRVRASGDIVFGGSNSLAGGNGGDGGAAVGAPTASSTNANAIGGAGGDGSSGSGTNGPVYVQAKGNITISGQLFIVVGHAGAGGAATATATKGNDGNPGQPGGAATATGGKGGNTVPYSLLGTNVSGLASVVVTGGNAGAGGKATAKGGNGGNGTQPSAAGGKGGDMKATGGNGGNAQTKDQNGALIGNGGDAGAIEIDLGNGGAGYSDCVPNAPAPAGNGGPGGNASGSYGTSGTGKAAGAAGNTTINTAGNGGTGGNPNGTGGAAGSNKAAVPQVVNGTSFTPGANGVPCPPPGSRTFTLTNGDATNNPWTRVAVSTNGGAFIPIAPNGATWTVDLNGTTDATEVILVIQARSTAGSTMNVYDEPAAFFLTHASSTYTGSIGGKATGSVSGTGTATTGQQEQIKVGHAVTTIIGPNDAFTVGGATINTPTTVQSVIKDASGTPLTYSILETTLGTGADVSSQLQPQKPFRTVPTVNGAWSNWAYVALFGLPDDDDDDDDDCWPCAFNPYTTFTAGIASFSLPAANATDLPAGVLQSFTFRQSLSQTTYATTRIFSRNATSITPAVPPAYTPLQFTLASGAPYVAFHIQGTIQSPYTSGQIKYRGTLGSKLFAFNEYIGYDVGGTINLTTPTDPIFTPDAPPSGSVGFAHATWYSYDHFAMPADGEIRYKGGFSRPVGNPPAPALQLGVTPTQFTVPAGGTTPLQVTATRTNFNGPVFIGSSSPGGGVAVTGTMIPAGQNTGTVVVSAATNATAGSHTVSIVGDAIANGIETPFTANVSAIVSTATPQLAITVASPDTIRLGTGQQFRNIRIPVHVTRTNFTGPVDISTSFGNNFAYVSPLAFTLPDGQSDTAFIVMVGSNVDPQTVSPVVTATSVVNSQTVEGTTTFTLTLVPWQGATYAVTITADPANDTSLNRRFPMQNVTQITLTLDPDSIASSTYFASGNGPWVTMTGHLGTDDSTKVDYVGQVIAPFQGSNALYQAPDWLVPNGMLTGSLYIVYPYPGSNTAVFHITGTRTSGGARPTIRRRPTR